MSQVCQFMHRPSRIYWQAVKRILHYLKQTFSHGLFLILSKSFTLEAFSDADWADCLEGRWSTSGYCVFLGKNLISWSSCKQPAICRSSNKAQYKSIANTAAKLLWIQALLRDLGNTLTSPKKLRCSMQEQSM